MFKKSLAALAILGAFAGVTSAATFQLYGTVDEALVYNYSRVNDSGDVTKDNSLNLSSGYQSASKFGFVGSEDLGNGLKVGFTLENQFSADDGTLTEGLLFRRQASLYLAGDFGRIEAGRMGGVGSSAGTYDVVYAIGDAFDGFDNDIGGLVASARYDNMITYQTPKFAGVQATVQYSFKTKGTEDTQSSKNEQYAGAAVTGEFGPLNTVVAYEYLNRAAPAEGAYKRDNGHIVYVGANYDCGFAKTFAMAQYFKGVSAAFGAELEDDDDATGFKGYGMTIGTQFPVAGGDTTVALYWADGKAEYEDEAGDDTQYFGLAARYSYPLSKRTSIYAGAGVAKSEFKEDEGKSSTTFGQAYLGLTHQF